MKSIWMLVAWFLMGCLAVSQQSESSADVSSKAPHDREFWRAIAKNHYAVPEGQQVFPLLRELSGYVGLRDSELRDDLAYSITTVWIKRQKQISVDELDSLLDEWEANLRVGIGNAPVEEWAGEGGSRATPSSSDRSRRSVWWRWQSGTWICRSSVKSDTVRCWRMR